MFIRILFITFLSGVFHSVIFGQNPVRVDSLRTAIKVAKQDTVRAKLLFDLAWELKTRDVQEADSLASASKELSVKLNYARGEARALRLQGILQRIAGNNSEAILLIKKSIRINDSIGSLKGLVDCYNSLGEVYRMVGDYSEALKYYQKSLDFAQKINDRSAIGLVTNNIGIIYNAQKDLDKELEMYLKALAIREELGEKGNVAATLNNIANCYGDKGDYESSFQYQQRALAINRELHHKKGIALSFENIGIIRQKQSRFDEALKYLDSSNVIFNEINDSANITYTSIAIGKTLFFLNRLTEAKEKLLIGYTMSRRMGLKQHRLAALDGLLTVAEKQNDSKASFLYLKEMYYLRDSILNESKLKSMHEIETRFETKEKEAAIEMLSQKNQLQRFEMEQKESELGRGRLIIYTSIGGGVLVIILLLVLLNRYNLKKKVNEELALKNMIVGEKNKNILDSITYAQRIQNALLASEDILNENLKDYFVLYMPKDIVSGDFYWATRKENDFYLAICDSTGHGVPGAFMSLLNISFLNEAITEKGIKEPGKIFDHTRKKILENLASEDAHDGMDGILFRIGSGEISYSGAYNSPVIIHQGEIFEPGTDKMPVGRSPRSISEFTTIKPDVKKGDMIYAFTDGFADQFGGPQGKKLKRKNLIQLLQNIHSLPLSEQKNKLKQKMSDWKGNLEQVDDILIIGFKI